MHGTIECAFIGRLGQEPELKSSAAGKPRAPRSMLWRDDEPPTAMRKTAIRC